MSKVNTALNGLQRRLAYRIDLDREAGDPNGAVAGMEAAYRMVAESMRWHQTREKAPSGASEDLPVLDCQFGIETAPSAVYSLLAALQHADHVGDFRMVITKIQ